MPAEFVSFAALPERIAALEADGQEVVSIATASDMTAVVVTRPKARRSAGGRETR